MINKFKFTPIEGLQNEGAFPDDPGDIAALREQLQRLHNQTRDYINELTDKYSSNLVGKSGSNEIGSEAIAGLMDPDNPLLPALTVYAQIRAAQKNIDDLVAGIIPDGSINTQKLTEGAVTPTKISGGVGCNYIRNRIPAAGDNLAAGYRIGNTWTVPYMTLNNLIPHPTAITSSDWTLQNGSLAGSGSKGTLTCGNGASVSAASVPITPIPGHIYILFGALKVTSANVISEISVGTDKQINPVKNTVYNLCEIITAPTEFKIQIKAATAAALNAATLEFDKVCVVDMTADMAGVPFDKSGAIAYFSTHVAFSSQIPEYAGMNWYCQNNGAWQSSSQLSPNAKMLFGLNDANANCDNALVVANNRMNEIFTQVMRINLKQSLAFYNYDNLIMDALATNGYILSSSLDYVSNSLTGKLLNPTLATDEVLKINNGGSTETARRGPTVQWKFPITVPSTGYITKIEISGFSTYDGWTRGLSAEFYTNNGGELGSLLRSATASVSWGNGSVAYTKTLVLPEAIYAEAGTSIFVVVTMNSGSSVLSSLYYTNGGTASIQYRMGTTGAWTTEVSGVTPYCKLYMASTFTASIVTKLIDVPLHDREIYTGYFTALPPSLKHNIYRSIDGIAFLAIMMDRVEVFSAIDKFCIKHVLEANIVDSKIPNSVSSLVTFKGYGAILNYGV